MTIHFWQTYLFRRLCSSLVALVLALIMGYFLNHHDYAWVVFGALVVMPTTRGTPVRQGLISLMAGLLVVIIGFVSVHYFLQVEWTTASEQMLQSKLLLMVVGACISITCGLTILPVMQYQEFRYAMLQMLDVFIHVSSTMRCVIVEGGRCHHALQTIPYPEWVFESGFNRNYRGSFRYILIQLNRVMDAFYSLDYYIHQSIDADMRAEVANQLAAVMDKNNDLLEVIRAFFANEISGKIHENYISDITELRNISQVVLPDNLELLDLSRDYTIIAAMVRDVMDVRELLLQILTALPMDELVVTAS